MSRTADITLSGWVVETKIESKSEFIQLYYDKGPLGFYIYILMRNIICGQGGYYAILNDSLIVNIHCKLGKWTKPIKFIKELIEYFGKIGILDKSMLKNNILTSADIQKSWLNAQMTQRTRLTNVDLKYWLLVDKLPTDTNNDTCSNNNNSCSKNEDNCSNNDLSCTQDNTRQNTIIINNDKCITYTEIVKLYKEKCPHLIPFNGGLTRSRKFAMNTCDLFTEQEFTELFERANASEFLQGKNESNFKASFDWIIKPENIAKIMNGNFDITFNRNKNQTNSQLISDRHVYTKEQLEDIFSDNDEENFDF